MSTTPVTTPPARPTPTGRAPRLTAGRVIRSESTKLLTLRAPWVLAASMVTLSAAAAAIVALTQPDGIDAAAAATRAIAPVAQLGQLFLAVIAVLLVTNEFASGQIRTTATSVPKRTPALGAKVVVAIAVAVSLTIVSAAAAWATSTIVLLAGSDSGPAALGPDALQSVGATGAWLVAVAVFSVLVATVVRHAAAGIVLVMATLYILPVAVQLISLATGLEAGQYLFTSVPSTLDGLFSGSGFSSGLGIGLAVLMTWLAVPAVVAAQLTNRRDV